MKRTTNPWMLFGVLLGLAFPAQAADYYLTVAGAGAKNGSDWANAYDVGALWTTVNTTMQPGDMLYLGGAETSGGTDYGDTRLTISSSGTAAARMSLVGVDRGFGYPKFKGIQQTRSYTTITLADGVGYWTIKNLYIEHRDMGVVTSGTGHPGIVMDGVTVRDIKSRGFSLTDCDDLLLQNCRAERYSEIGFRFNHSNDRVTVKNCVADCTGTGNVDDDAWWGWTSDPVGFDLHVKNTTTPFNTDILMEDCEALNNKEDNGDSFLQGDGFKMEGRNDGVTLIRCKSYRNRDAAFDLKGSNQTLEDCIAVNNNRYGFKVWYDGVLTNCVAVNNGSRQFQLPATTSGNTIIAEHCTFHCAAGTQIGVATETAGNTGILNNCIISFAGTAGTYTGGPGTIILDGTVKLANASNPANPPMYVNPILPWDGEGTDFDNQTYGTTKGYNSAGYSGGGGGTEIIVDNTDSSGVTITGSWTSSTFTAGYYGSNYLHDGDTGKGSKSVRFTPTISTSGSYEVFAHWTSGANRASNVPVDVIHAGGTAGLSVDQRTGGGQWVSLGTYDFDAGTGGSVLIGTTGTDGHVIADAVKFVEVTGAGSAIPSLARIINSYTSKSLRPYNAGTGDNVNIVQFAYDNTWASEQWQITDLGNNYYSILNVYTGKSLRPLDSSISTGANIVQYAFDSSWQSEQWELIPDGTGYYGIRNRYSGLALRPLNSGLGDNVQIVQEPYDSSLSSMKWQIADP